MTSFTPESLSAYPEFEEDRLKEAIEYLSTQGEAINFVGSAKNARRILYAFERPPGGGPAIARLNAKFDDEVGVHIISVLERYEVEAEDIAPGDVQDKLVSEEARGFFSFVRGLFRKLLG